MLVAMMIWSTYTLLLAAPAARAVDVRLHLRDRGLRARRPRCRSTLWELATGRGAFAVTPRSGGGHRLHAPSAHRSSTTVTLQLRRRSRRGDARVVLHASRAGIRRGCSASPCSASGSGSTISPASRSSSPESAASNGALGAAEQGLARLRASDSSTPTGGGSHGGQLAFQDDHRRRGALAEPRDAARGRLRRHRLREADRRRRERPFDHEPVQRRHPAARRPRDGGAQGGGRDAAGVRRAHHHRRHRHGHRGDEVLARVARGDRRRDRDERERPGDGRRARGRRLRQEHARRR